MEQTGGRPTATALIYVGRNDVIKNLFEPGKKYLLDAIMR